MTMVPPEWADPPVASAPATTIPATAGEILELGRRSMAAKDYTFRGMIRAASSLDAKDLWQLCVQRMTGEANEYRFIDWPDQYVVARYVAGRVIGFHSKARGWLFEWGIRASNPYKFGRDDAPYVIPVGGLVHPILGSAPSFAEFAIFGPCSGPAIIYRDAQGNVLGDLSFNVTLLDKEWIRVHLQTRKIERMLNTGILIDAASTLVEGLPQWFALNPHDGDAYGGPSVEAVNGTAIMNLTRCWY